MAQLHHSHLQQTEIFNSVQFNFYSPKSQQQSLHGTLFWKVKTTINQRVSVPSSLLAALICFAFLDDETLDVVTSGLWRTRTYTDVPNTADAMHLHHLQHTQVTKY